MLIAKMYITLISPIISGIVNSIFCKTKHLKSLNKPIDAGKNFIDKKRIFGDNNGTVTGVARVIESFDEIDRLEENDILVTRFTDTGWTPKFAILKGIVTEYGGVLCHAAIVSREYGIPAIVSTTNIMNEIKDGEIITINGTTGTIRKGK